MLHNYHQLVTKFSIITSQEVTWQLKFLHVSYKFVKVVKIIVNEWAKGIGTILTNLHDGNSTIDDSNILLSRTPNNIPDLESFRNDSVRLSFGNEEVAQDNFQSLKELGYQIATLNAKHNNSTATKFSSDDMGSLQPKLLLSKGANFMAYSLQSSC